jgi:hypothetical protein
MRVQFHRSDQRDAYVVLVRREDGLTVQLPGYDRDMVVPHHLAHFVAEHGFRLTHGVFGCIAAGAMFGNMSLVGGRSRYDAAARSRTVLRVNAAELGLAESLSGVVHEAAEQDLDLAVAYRRLRAAWRALRPGPCPYEQGDLRRILSLLGQLGDRWHALAPGGVLALRWAVPAAPAPVPAPRVDPVPGPDVPAPARRFSLSGGRPDGDAPE